MGKMPVRSKVTAMTSPSIFFMFIAMCLLPSLVTGPRLMSISSVILELWQLSFIRNEPETWKSKLPLFEFCPISGHWGKLGGTGFRTNISTENLMNAAKHQSYNFYCVWVIKGKKKGMNKITPRLNADYFLY